MSAIVLSDAEQQAVEEGEAARFLLDSPAFLTAIEAVRAECAEAILTSNPQDRQGREDAYNLSRGLSAVTVRLTDLAARAEGILAEAEANTEQPDQAEEPVEQPDY
jgi:hypothetical protein